MNQLIRRENAAAHTALLRLNRPEKLNALSTAMITALARHLQEFGDDDDIRCVVVTGDRRAFSAGADIKELEEHAPDGVFDPIRSEAWRAIEGFEKPIIAAVDGYCLGSGIELAMLADFIVAGETAVFGHPEVQIGATPGDGGTQRLVRSVGKSIAMQMILTGEQISARQAMACGLIAAIAENDRTVEAACVMAIKIAQAPPLAAQLAKRAVNFAHECGLSAGLAFERDIAKVIASSTARQDGLVAFNRRNLTIPSKPK